MTIKFTILLLLFISITSCATLQSDNFVSGQINLNKENLLLLNGTYSRKPLSQSDKWKGDLFWNFYTKGINGVDSLCTLKLNVVNENNLNVTLLENNKILKSKIFKGKIKNGYFEMKRRIFFIPAIYINIFRITKFRIGLLENNNLTTDYKKIDLGTGFFVIPFYDSEKEFDFEYNKVN